MSFDTYFRVGSFATVAAAALALLIAGAAGFWVVVPFTIVGIVAWKLEGSRWQLSERVVLILIIAALPLFYFDWRVLTPYLEIEFLETGKRGNAEVTVLAHLILFLSAVKLLQRKADRDWFFLYLISFFEVLLAAGLSASPIFLATLALYLLCALSTVVAFEIQKARRKAKGAQTRLLVAPESTIFRRFSMKHWQRRYLETRRLPLVSAGLLILIVVLALPFFLVAPRTASSALTRTGGGLAGFIGFSDRVELGQIGKLKGSDEIVMRVRVEEGIVPSNLRWRGIALDEFNGREWFKSAIARRWEQKTNDRGFFQVGTTADVRQLTLQTVFLEPLDTPVLFGAPRVVALQGKLLMVGVDSEGAIQTQPHDQDRLVYKIYSDTTEPAAAILRADHLDYFMPFARYLQLPEKLDPRIAVLARNVVAKAGAQNGYDKARAIENHLRDSYAYSLDLKAGGPDPLADFLFNVRSGHCEYFSTAMVVMLRTQGIAARVVNGFLPGDFNATSGAYTVRQSDAHSWVEAYFPQTASWVTFDPTPAAGRTPKTRSGLAARLSRYSEALELMWFQYVIGYDKQEQRSLATSMRRRLLDVRRGSSAGLERMSRVLPALTQPVVLGITALSILLAAALVLPRVRRLGWRSGLKVWQTSKPEQRSPIEFYERMLKLLREHGITREPGQTPLEFANKTRLDEAISLTRVYNRVRFGRTDLTRQDRAAIDSWLRNLEQKATRGD